MKAKLILFFKGLFSTREGKPRKILMTSEEYYGIKDENSNEN